MAVVRHYDEKGIVKPRLCSGLGKILAQAVIGIIGTIDIFMLVVSPFQRMP